jgi:hypothetical protein
MITENCVVGCTNDKHHSICDHSRAFLPLWINDESPDDLYYSKTFDQYELLKIDLSFIIVRHKLINDNTTAQFRYKKKFFIHYVLDILELPLNELSKLILIDEKNLKIIKSKKLISPLDRWIDGDFKSMEKKLFKINDTNVCVSK